MTGTLSRRRWLAAAVAGAVVLSGVGVYLVLPRLPPPEPWYELGNPGTASNGGSPIYVGCNNTPWVTGAAWPAAAQRVTLMWYGTTHLLPLEASYSIGASGQFEGAAPPIDPTNVTGAYWLLVWDEYLDQTGVLFDAVAVPAGQACP